MPVQSSAALNSLAERMIFRVLTPEELPKVAVLKQGKAFADLIKAFKTPINGEVFAASHERMVAMYANRLFKADIVENSLVPDDGF